MIRTITFLGLLLVAVLSLNAEIPVTVDPENPPDGGGSGLKAPPMSLTVYIDVERGCMRFSPISINEVESVGLTGSMGETVIAHSAPEAFVASLMDTPSGIYILRVECRGRMYSGELILP